MKPATNTWVLVTGGAGYIGSHATLALQQAGYRVLVLDNLANSSPLSIRRVGQISGQEPLFIEGDVRDRERLDALFKRYPVSAVLHFAGLKAVGESAREPLRYYDNNVAGTLTLCGAMAAAGVCRLVFSSSATVYGENAPLPYREDSPPGRPSNPYGRSKLMVEDLLSDLAKADARWSVALLRYFNPVGAHESGLIGEDPQGIPNNLLPYIARVATGRLAELPVFGNDYPTPDGTGVRDYIHVMDLAEGHVAALAAMFRQTGLAVWNLGTGQGHSVLEMVRAFESVSGRSIPIRIAPRRAGDLAAYWADAEKARRELGWQARRDLMAMLRDTWRWQSSHPDGYRQPADKPPLRGEG